MLVERRKKWTGILGREREPRPGWCSGILVVTLPLILHMEMREGSKWPPGGQRAMERGAGQACCGVDSDTEGGWEVGSGGC